MKDDEEVGHAIYMRIVLYLECLMEGIGGQY
jgi:hypothetical protein